MESKQSGVTAPSADVSVENNSNPKKRSLSMRGKPFLSMAIVLGVLLVAVASFAAGVKVGVHKALFSSKWGKNYEQNFLGHREERGVKQHDFLSGRMGDKGLRNGHGVAGEALSVSGDTIIIKDSENQESTVRINESTIINRGRDTAALGDIQAGERVVVVGKPQEDGVIAAHLIRVFGKTAQ